MGNGAQQAFNAADVADAVFSSMRLHHSKHTAHHAPSQDPETVHHLLGSIDDGLKAAGLSFAEYLERVRHLRALNQREEITRWRFSARERAVQRVDSAMANLCALMQQSQ